MTACKQQEADPTTEPPVETTQPGNINGIPEGLFESTADQSFRFAMKNLETGNFFVVNSTTTVGEAADALAGGTYDKVSDMELSPHQTFLQSMTFCEVEECGHKIALGGSNHTEEKQTCREADLIYITMSGEPGWELCGVRLGMTQEEVISVLGEPTQAIDVSEGYSMEWFILRDGHTYMINVLYDSETQEMDKVILNIDNHAMY